MFNPYKTVFREAFSDLSFDFGSSVLGELVMQLDESNLSVVIDLGLTKVGQDNLFDPYEAIFREAFSDLGFDLESSVLGELAMQLDESNLPVVIDLGLTKEGNVIRLAGDAGSGNHIHSANDGHNHGAGCACAGCCNDEDSNPAEAGTNNPTFLVSSSGVQLIDAVIHERAWSETTLNYAFPTDETAFNYDGTGLEGLVANFSAVTTLQEVATNFVLDADSGPTASAGFSVEALTGLTIINNGNANITDAHIRISNTTDSALGTARVADFPDGGITTPTADDGDVWFGPLSNNIFHTPTAGNYAWAGHLHEVGHALGLKHGHSDYNFGVLPFDMDSMEYSVMTYRSYVGATTSSGYTNETWGYAQSFMIADIATLQYLYGVNFDTNSGDTVYSWDPSSGDTLIDGAVAINAGGNRIFATLWDGDGIDTYNLSAYTNGTNIDLRPGSHSVFDDAQLAGLGNGNFSRGNIFNALQFEGDERSLIENAIGGSGNDIIQGNQAENELIGGQGNDTLIGRLGEDRLIGGAGDDTLYGGLPDTGQTSSITFGSGELIRDANANNTSLTSALSVDGLFSLASDANIIDATTIPHVSIDATQGDAPSVHYYSVTLSAGATITLDIDNGSGTGVPSSIDSWVELYNAAGDLLAFNDDSSVSSGSGGSVSSLDSFLSVTVATAGVYYFAVGTYNGLSDIAADGAYDLQVSVDEGNVEIDEDMSNDSLFGGAGNDTLYGGQGNDIAWGGSGDDSLYGDAGDDTLNGNSGDDVIEGGVGIDTINGGGGSDDIFGGDGDDALSGSIGEDLIRGGNGNDTIFGNNQNDIIFGNGGVDTLNGGAGNDTLDGGGAADVLIGGAGQDTLFGQVGNDNLSGGAGGDDLFGGSGDDIINGGGGNDILNGGTGADQFILNLGFGTDRIQDFEDGVDLIDFSDNVLADDFADVLAAATQVGANIRIELNSNNVLIIENFDIDDLDMNDFLF